MTALDPFADGEFDWVETAPDLGELRQQLADRADRIAEQLTARLRAGGLLTEDQAVVWAPGGTVTG